MIRIHAFTRNLHVMQSDQFRRRFHWRNWWKISEFHARYSFMFENVTCIPCGNPQHADCASSSMHAQNRTQRTSVLRLRKRIVYLKSLFAKHIAQSHSVQTKNARRASIGKRDGCSGFCMRLLPIAAFCAVNSLGMLAGLEDMGYWRADFSALSFSAMGFAQGYCCINSPW